MGLTIICAPFISPALRKYCLPYIPATNQQLENILNALRGRKGTVLDLGSGDGRIVIGNKKLWFSLMLAMVFLKENCELQRKVYSSTQ